MKMCSMSFIIFERRGTEADFEHGTDTEPQVGYFGFLRYTSFLSRGGVTVTRKAHNLEIPGAIPGPATSGQRKQSASGGLFSLAERISI